MLSAQATIFANGQFDYLMPGPVHALHQLSIFRVWNQN